MDRAFPPVSFRELYDRFDAPVTEIDCGKMCAPHNPGGKPFCCDICHAVPAAYKQEWEYLRQNTDLWHEWRGEQEGCSSAQAAARQEDADEMRASTPEYVLLLACKGPAHCQRNFRALSCRQFPFFPYVTSDYRFIGLAYDWAVEANCWVISNLGAVTETYRREFVRLYDDLFSLWLDDFESYAILSEQAREHFASQKRRIPILHRNGGYYLLSPGSERLRRVSPERFRSFGPYKK